MITRIIIIVAVVVALGGSFLLARKTAVVSPSPSPTESPIVSNNTPPPEESPVQVSPSPANISPSNQNTNNTVPVKTPAPSNTSSKVATFDKLNIGVVVNSSEISEDTKEHTPLALYLSKKLTGTEINGKVILRESIIEMADLMRRGEVDLLMDTPFSAGIVQKLSGGKVIAFRAKGGVETYKSYIFVRADSNLKTLKDLVGKKIAFESADSTSNYFLPKAELKRAGFKVEPLNPDGSVKQDTIGYYFTVDDGIIIPDVFRGKAQAGGRNSVSYIKETASIGDKLLIIATTPSVYRNVVIASPKLSDGQVKKIQEVLFAMDKDPEGQSTLTKAGKTLYFKPIDPNSVEAKTMQSLADEMNNEIIEARESR